jgi:MYXO-CTERM domain-containing protein
MQPGTIRFVCALLGVVLLALIVLRRRKQPE